MPFRIGDTAVTVDRHGKAHFHKIRESQGRRRGRGRSYDAKVRAGKVDGPPTPKTVRRRAARATKAVEKSTASRPIETLRRAERKIARTTDREKRRELREATKRLRHALASQAAFNAARSTPEGSPVKANFPEPALKSVAPRAYRKARRTASGAHPSSRGLGEPEDLTTAITVVAPGGGFAGAIGRKAAEVGAKEVAGEVGEAIGSKVEASATKAATKALDAGSGVRAAGRLAAKAARRAAGKDTTKLGERAARAAAAKAARRAEAKAAEEASRSASAAVPGVGLAKAATIQALPVTRGHREAIEHNPIGVAKRTAIGAGGLILGPAKAAADLGLTTGRAASEAAHELHVPGARGYSAGEIAAPVVGLGEEQLDFARQVAEVVTASDPKVVQKEVEDNLGLMLPIMLGLGTKAAAEKLTKGRITEGVRRLAQRARREPLDEFRGETPRVLEKQGQRKTEARRIANARGRAHREEEGATGAYLRHARAAKGGEVVRRDVGRGRGRVARVARRGAAGEEARGNLVIRPGDVVPFATRHSIDLSDPARAIEQVRAVRKALKAIPENVRLPQSKLATRDLLDYIEHNADVLSDPHVRAALEERRKAGAYRREHAAELEPEHSERARFSSVAAVKGRPMPEHMFPESVRDITRATPQRGRLSKDVLRREARRDRASARRSLRKAATVEKKAAIMRRELETREKLNNLDRRGHVRRGSAPVGGHLRLVEGDGRLPRATLPALHDRIRDRIDRLDAQAVALREKAARSEEMAKAKHAASQGFDPALEEEFARREAADLAAEGRPMPEYVSTARAREQPGYGATGAKLSQFPGRSKLRKGTAEEYGLVEEGVVPDLRESFRRPITRRESYKALRGMLDENEFRVADKDEWSSDEIRELYDEGLLKRGQWVAVPRQLYKRSYGKFDPETAAAEMRLALDGEAPGRRFKLVRKAAADEFFDQLAPSLLSRRLVKVNRATSGLILGTSPAWAASQVVAEYLQGALAQPKILNPRWVRRATEAYRRMTPHRRQAFDSWVGVTAREMAPVEDAGVGNVEGAAEAYTALHDTPLGKVLTSLRDFDRYKGGRIRALVAISKIDKDVNGPLRGFLRGVGKLDQEMGAQLRAMRGKPLETQLDWIADHPKFADRYQGYLDDVMGNWSALTKRERVASQLMIFYPFLRMSLRWTFYAFPKHHPIRAAVLTWLSQQNATELRRLLGGDPSYFTGWMKIPVSLGHGKVDYVSLSRIVPGASAPLEAIGGGIEGPKGTVAIRVAQPVLGAAATLATGVDPLTGKQEKGSFWAAVEQLFPTDLSAPGRALKEVLTPAGRKAGPGAGKAIAPIFGTERQHSLDKLIAKLDQYGKAARYARTLGLPMLPETASRVEDSALLGRVLTALERNGSDARGQVASAYADRMTDAVEEGRRAEIARLRRDRDRELTTMEAEYADADAALDKLFARWGIPHAREDELEKGFYDEGRYGSKPKSDYQGVTIGGKGHDSGITFGNRPRTGSGITFGSRRGRATSAPAPRITFGR